MRKLAIVGTGQRCIGCFGTALTKDYSDKIEIVGIYDINYKKAEAFCDILQVKLPIYRDFNTMLKDAKPDTVLVTCVDKFHHEYIVKAMEGGCDVISEKPMTTDAARAKEIFAAQRKYGKKLTVTFNCRFMPYLVKIKEIIASGVLGNILKVDYQYTLDRFHGADYYRRWHRKMDNSGGLLVHKSTHHFDVLNWLLNDVPSTVSAECSLSYYGEKGAFRGERCRDCAHKDQCEFYWDINAGNFYKKFYAQTEDIDGYYRDSCVYSKDIDIFDNMSVNLKYEKGAIATYTLTSFNTYEGYHLAITGDKARLDAEEVYSGVDTSTINKLSVTENLTHNVTHTYSKPQGTHSGGDAKMCEMLFGDGSKKDPLGQLAAAEDGLISLLTGACANISAVEGRTIDVQAAFKECISK